MNKRILVAIAMIGQRMVLQIQGDGNVLDVLDKAGEQVLSKIPGQEGTILQKRIFNVKGASQIAMASPLAKSLLKNGFAAETAKGTVIGLLTNDPKEVAAPHTADEYFTAYLNYTQVSFGVLLPSAIADRLANGVEVAARVEKVTTENGSLLTVDASSISVLEPKHGTAVAFDISDYLKEEVPVGAVGATQTA